MMTGQPQPTTPAAPASGAFVVLSSLVVAEPGMHALEEAFSARLHSVDEWSGHHGLQVWREVAVPGQYAMVSWWQDQKSFAHYMRSTDHHASHARVPSGPYAPRLQDLRRFQVIAT